MTTNVSLTSDPNQTTLPVILAPSNSSADPIEKWVRAELNTEERKAFLGLLSQPGHEGVNFDQFLDSAPSFGHLLTYITILKEKIPQGCDNHAIRLFLKSFMERVCKRLITLASHQVGCDQPSILQSSMQDCLLEIVSSFHCCFETYYWPYDPNELFVWIRLPKCDDEFKIYRLAYLTIRLIDLFDENRLENDILETKIASLETGLKDPIMLLADESSSKSYPNEFGTLLKLLNSGFSISSTKDKDLETILNSDFIKWCIIQDFSPCCELFFRILTEARIHFELKTLPFAVKARKELAPFRLESLMNHLQALIYSILFQYTRNGSFEIRDEEDDERLLYVVSICRTDGKIQGEEALDIIKQVLHHLIPSDTQYVIAEDALSSELLDALPKCADIIEIRESFSQPQSWAIKADLIRHFAACKNFRIPVKSITSELLNAFQEINFETIDRLEILTSERIVDLTQKQLQLYDKFMGMFPQGKGTIEFPTDQADKLPLTVSLPGTIVNYPKLGVAILDQWLISNRLEVPETASEVPIFTRMLMLCLGNQTHHERLTDIVNIEFGNLRSLLIFIIKNPELKDALRQCPDFALSLLSCHNCVTPDVGHDEWLELFEYLLKRKILSPENLEDNVRGPSRAPMIFGRLIKNESTQLAKHLVPAATELCSSVLKMFGNGDLKKGFALLLNEGWNPSFTLPLSGSVSLRILMLKPIKKSLPFTDSNAIQWFAAIMMTRPTMNEEEQKDFLDIFKHFFSERKNPLPAFGANGAKWIQQNPILLEGLLEEYHSIHFLKNAFPLGLAIAEAAFTNAPSDPSLFRWKKHSCILLLDSLKLINVKVEPNANFDGALAHLNPLKNNIYLARSLLPYACVLSKKGKIKTTYPFAASFLTKISLTDTPPLSTEDAKVCAAILLGRNVDKIQEIPSLTDENLKDALLQRIVEHSPRLSGLSPICWEMILQKATAKIAIIESLPQETVQAKEQEILSFLIPFLRCLIVYNESFNDLFYCILLHESFEKMFKKDNHRKIMQSALGSLCNDKNFVKEVKSGKLQNTSYLVGWLSKCQHLNESEQHFLYQAWKKQLVCLTNPKDMIFPVNHLDTGNKIMAYIAKNPTYFLLHKEKVALFLVAFCKKFDGQFSLHDQVTIMDKIPINLSKDLFNQLFDG